VIPKYQSLDTIVKSENEFASPPPARKRENDSSHFYKNNLSKEYYPPS